MMSSCELQRTTGWWMVAIVALLTIWTPPASAQGGDVSIDQRVRVVRRQLGLPDTSGNPRGGGTVIMQVGSASGAPGALVTFGVNLDDAGESVAGVQIDIGFDPLTQIREHPLDPGTPDCTVNPGINKEATAFAFRPPGCTIGVDCTAIRALVLSFINVDPIADGSLLFTCNVDIDASAPLDTYPLPCSNAGAADPDGNALPSGCTPGAITVQAGGSTQLDHYKCYQGKDLKNPHFAKTTASTADQFGSETVAVQKLKFVCTPVDKNGEGINDPNAHLTCYQVKGNPLGAHVQVSTQFQTSQLALKKPKLLCVPSTKTLIP